MDALELLGIAGVLVGAIAQAITGLGFALVCVPFLTLALGGADGVRFANVVGIWLSLLVIARERRGADIRHVVLLLVPAVIATPLAAIAIKDASPRLLSIGSGVAVLMAVGALASGLRVHHLAGKRGAVIAGALSGTMNVIGGVGGPAVAIYVTNANWTARRIRPTLALYFFILNFFSVAARGIPEIRWVFSSAVVVAIAVGFTLGSKVSNRLDHDMVRRGVLGIAALGALGAIIQS